MDCNAIHHVVSPIEEVTSKTAFSGSFVLRESRDEPWRILRDNLPHFPFDKQNAKYILCNMKTATSVKLDKAIKEEASKLASRMGLNLSSVVNATLKKFVTERRVVFSLSPEFNAKTERSFLKIKSDIRKRKNLIGPFDNLTDLKKSLLN